MNTPVLWVSSRASSLVDVVDTLASAIWEQGRRCEFLLLKQDSSDTDYLRGLHDLECALVSRFTFFCRRVDDTKELRHGHTYNSLGRGLMFNADMQVSTIANLDAYLPEPWDTDKEASLSTSLQKIAANKILAIDENTGLGSHAIENSAVFTFGATSDPKGRFENVPSFAGFKLSSKDVRCEILKLIQMHANKQ